MKQLLPSLLSLLIAGGAAAQPPADAGAALREAATKGDLAAVKALLDSGTDVNAASEYGATALSFAADKGRLEVVKLLLARGANVEATDTFYQATPITWAASNGHAEVVTALLAAGAVPGPAMGMAVARQKTEVIKAILASGKAPIESLSGTLAMAKQMGAAEIVKVLEEAGVKPPPPANAQIDPAILATYAGEYSSPQFSAKVTLVENKLQLSFMGQPNMEMGAVDATHFRLLAFEGATFEFKSEGGKVTTLRLEQGGQTIDLARKSDAVPPPTNP